MNVTHGLVALVIIPALASLGWTSYAASAKISFTPPPFVDICATQPDLPQCKKSGK